MLHIALKPRPDSKLAGAADIALALYITMDDSLQFKIVGAVQAVIEKRIDDLEEARDDESEEDGEDEDDAVRKKRKVANKGRSLKSAYIVLATVDTPA